MKKRKTTYEIPQADKIPAEQTGRLACPKCEPVGTVGMMFLDNYATKKEFYCDKCRTSVPLFER